MPSGGFLDISFEVQGQREVLGKLHTAGAKIENMAPAWEQVGTELLKDFAQNFQDEGGAFGKGAWAQWAPLASSTVMERKRLGYPGEHPILVREGTLMASATERGAAGNVFEVGANSLVVGTTIRYAKYHQFGSRDGKLPMRRIVGITPQRAGWQGQAGSIINMLQQYVNRIIREQGLQG